MDVENDTDREVEYEQTGGGLEIPGAPISRGGPPPATPPCRGNLAAKGRRSIPRHCGDPPWTVVFKERGNGPVIATSPPITGKEVTVRLQTGDTVLVLP